MFCDRDNKGHDESIRIIHRALDAGINFIDTRRRVLARRVRDDSRPLRPLTRIRRQAGLLRGGSRRCSERGQCLAIDDPCAPDESETICVSGVRIACPPKVKE
jgi:hypothetical protein